MHYLQLQFATRKTASDYA